MVLGDSKIKHFNFISGSLGKTNKWKWRDRLSKHPENQTGEETAPHFLLEDTHLQHA